MSTSIDPCLVDRVQSEDATLARAGEGIATSRLGVAGRPIANHTYGDDCCRPWKGMTQP
jgi:hypothetical protein